MDTGNISQASQAATSTDWTLLVRWVGAIAGWVAALAGWTAFYFQRKRNVGEDFFKWDSEFVAYRREHLKPFAETIRVAYGKFIGGHSNVPETWEEAVHTAKWPKNLPMPENIPLQLWRDKYGVGLDAEDEHLFRFAEAIYPRFNEVDKRPLRNRSVLAPDDFDAFDKARGGIADYFERCGYFVRLSKTFGRFLNEKVRPNHYYKIKIIAYLELALVRAWGPRSETGSGKVNLFRLGESWKTDDKRS